MAKKIKIKTHSGAKKRFNISKNGKVRLQRESVSTVLQDTATRRTLQKLRSSYLTNKN